MIASVYAGMGCWPDDDVADSFAVAEGAGGLAGAGAAAAACLRARGLCGRLGL